MLKFEPNAHQDIDIQTKKMRPYKKRSFYNRPQNNESNMDVENSDDSEKQVSSPPAADNVDKEKNKEKEGEIKNRVKWQRKTSRKQFRHHTIEVFRPREYPSTTLLKQKDSSPTHSRKPDAPSKESITESIVSSLGGQKALNQKLIRTIDGILKNDGDKNEENNNINGTQNNNNVGKHQLPAIIMETPLGRRRSLENNSLPKANFVKNADETNTKKVQHDRSFHSKIPGDMPLLQLTEANEDVSSSNRDAQSEDSQASSEPLQDAVMDTSLSNNALSDINADLGVQGLGDLEVSSRIDREDTTRSKRSPSREKAHAFHEHRTPGQIHDRHLDNRNVAHIIQEQQTGEQMETDYPLEEQPENLSLRRRYSTEVPVDLSKKSIAIPNRQIESLNDFQNDRQRPTYVNAVNGGFNESESAKLSSNYFQSNMEIARNPFEEPANVQMVRKESNNSYKTSDYAQYDVTAFQKNYVENLTRFTRKSPSETIKTPPPYTKEYPAQVAPHNVLADRSVKIHNLNKWRYALQLLLGQQFNAQVLDSMSLAYRQLDMIKDEAYVPAEVRSKVQKVLTETYDFISQKLKRHFSPDLNASDVIKILGQPEANAEKNTLQSDLENIQRITHLDINDVPLVSPSVNHHFAQNKYMQNYRELPKTPPSLYMNNFVPPRHQTANAERHFSKVPSPIQPDPHQRSPLEVNKQSVPMNYHSRMQHVTKPSDHPMHPVSPLSGSETSSIQFLAPTFSHLGYLRHPLSDMRRLYAYQSDIKDHIPKNHSSGRPRSKSHRNTEIPGGPHQLKRSISNPHNVPIEKNYLGHPYIDNSRAPQARIPTYRHPPNTVPQNLLQFGDLSITPSHVMQKPPPYSSVVHPNSAAKDVIKYRHSFPEYPKKVHNNLRNAHSLGLNENQTPGSSSNNVPQKVLDVQNPHSLNTNNIEDKISSTTDHLEVSKIQGMLRPQVYDEKNLVDSRNVKPKEKSKTVPAVIVADTSMQITKEPTLPSKDTVIRSEAPEESDVRMTVITSSSENASSSEENLKQAVEKDQDENNSEFLVWLEKLKSNEKLKSKFLSQMGIIKKEESTFVAAGDCIEIIDSDEEKSVEPDRDSAKVAPVITPVPKEPHQTTSRPPSQESTQPQACASINIHEKIIPQENNATITIPRTLEITPAPITHDVPKSIKTPSLKPSLSKLDYIPPIALPYVATTTAYGEKYPPREQQTKTIYSPEIEPISPVDNEPSFAFPEVLIAPKIAVNADERGVVLREKVSSPSYVQKRKTPQGFADYQNDDSISTNRKSSEYAPVNSSKRRKSLDRPQTTTSPRVAPSGKLCYVRESHMFLRYFDDTQVELFIKNLSSQDEELLRTTGIDPEKIKNSYKHSNFGLEQLGKTEILRLPRDIEFSRKEDLPDVEEFVKESSLVEKFVPQDFADFYRYVTGFQIIKNKHPVSLQTFLTMYNTNRTTELLRKYLQRRDEESFGTIAR